MLFVSWFHKDFKNFFYIFKWKTYFFIFDNLGWVAKFIIANLLSGKVNYKFSLFKNYIYNNYYIIPSLPLFCLVCFFSFIRGLPFFLRCEFCHLPLSLLFYLYFPVVYSFIYFCIFQQCAFFYLFFFSLTSFSIQII